MEGRSYVCTNCGTHDTLTMEVKPAGEFTDNPDGSRTAPIKDYIKLVCLTCDHIMEAKISVIRALDLVYF